MAFYNIAVPHKDILEKNFSAEVYAAKLWDVYQKRGSDDYKDSKIFFDKTYLTNNLNKILKKIEDNFITVDLEFPYDQGKAIAKAQEGVEVLKREYDDTSMKLRIRGSRTRINQILALEN